MNHDTPPAATSAPRPPCRPAGRAGDAGPPARADRADRPDRRRGAASRARLVLPALALAALAGCSERGDAPTSGDARTTGGGAGAGDAPGTFDGAAGDGLACSVANMNAEVDASMRDYYLFADRVPRIDPAGFGSPESLIAALRVAPDRFSYVGDAALSAAFFEEGEKIDYGWIIESDARGRAVIALVQPGSPLEAAGVRRGEVLLGIDGTGLDEIASAEQADALLGTGDEVRTVRLAIEGTDGAVREVSVTRGRFDVRAVVDVRTLEPAGPGGPRVGYLHFLSFIETARTELDAAFEYLAGEDVDELVLDLRFNGGGRIDVAKELAGRIVGAGGAGRDFTRFRFNDTYQAAAEAQGLADELRVPFEPLADSLDLPRVHVLASARTCSASEMVVNALRPLMDVVVVGGRSCGKPFGTSGREFCGKVLHAVEVEFVNDAGVGDYADGIPADCAAADDLSGTLGDPAESLLAAALSHIADGTCRAAIAAGPGDAIARRDRAADAALSEPTNPYRNELTGR